MGGWEERVGGRGVIFMHGFHGAWLHFRRARVEVCIQCSGVQIQAKKDYIV